MRQVLLATVLSFFCACQNAQAQPKLHIDKTEFDFGNVEEGVELKHDFILHNDGNQTLEILEATSSCGCTIPVIKKKNLGANERSTLTVVMDTTMKQGDVQKEVHVKSNDPLKPDQLISLKVNVQDPHKTMGKDPGVKLFKGNCATCHVQMGEGKFGEDLYWADCAMCHGFKLEGKVGPGFMNLDYSNAKLKAHLRDVIANGSKIHRSMPGYSSKAGGPLSDEQIESLMKYLEWRAKENKN